LENDAPSTQKNGNEEDTQTTTQGLRNAKFVGQAPGNKRKSKGGVVLRRTSRMNESPSLGADSHRKDKKKGERRKWTLRRNL